MERVAPQLQISPKVENSLNLSQAAIQGIELLSLPLDRLEEVILQKVDENPALLLVTHEEKRKRQHNHLQVENQLGQQPSLYEHIMEQAREEFSALEMPIAQEIAGNLDEKGFLAANINEIAMVCNVTGGRVEKVLARIRHFDPLGIASKSAREALLVQAKAKHYRCAEIILANHYQDLLHGKYLEIAKELEITIVEVREILQREIKRLNPFPGHGFSTTPVVSRFPELEIRREEGKWKISFADDVSNKVVVASDFVPVDLWERKTINEAREFVQALSKRKALLVKLIMRLIEEHSAYLQGESEILAPLLIGDLAEELEVATSTLSRLISNKTVDTPRGLVVVRDLFSQKADDTSSKQRAKHLLKQLIKNESRKKPVRDNELSELLKGEHGISLSRRTIAKYRSEMGIPNASHRHEDRY